jgi:hypothetical protein
MRVDAFVCAVLTAVCVWSNTYDVYPYKEPLTLLVVASCSSLTLPTNCRSVFVKN